MIMIFFFCLTLSAGIGVLNMAKQAVSRMLGSEYSEENNQFWLLDKDVKSF